MEQSDHHQTCILLTAPESHQNQIAQRSNTKQKKTYYTIYPVKFNTYEYNSHHHNASFDCPDLKNYAEDKCMFRGRAYNVGERVADNIEADCNAECRCSK